MRLTRFLSACLLAGFVACGGSDTPVVTFERFLGTAEDDVAYSLLVNEDGEYVMLGYSESANPPWMSMYILIADAAGGLVGDRTLLDPTEGYDYSVGHCVAAAPGGGYLVSGNGSHSEMKTGKDAIMVETDSLLDPVELRHFGTVSSDEFFAGRPTSDGGCVFVGDTYVMGPDNISRLDLLVTKLDDRLHTEWFETYGELMGMEAGFDIREVSSGGYIAVGYGDGHVRLTRIDADGTLLWESDTNTPAGGMEPGITVVEASDGGFVVTTRGPLVKTDSIGTLLWTSHLDCEARCVRELPDGGFIVCGSVNVERGNDDACLVRTDSSGNPIWRRTYGESGVEVAYCVQPTSDGGFVLTGFALRPGRTDTDILLVKTDSAGRVRESVE